MGNTTWTDYRTGMGMYTDIDMSECEFVAPPNVVTSINGAGYQFWAQGKGEKDREGEISYSIVSSESWLKEFLTPFPPTGQSATYSITPTSFQVYIYFAKEHIKLTLQLAKDNNWSITWVAVGYAC